MQLGRMIKYERGSQFLSTSWFYGLYIFPQSGKVLRVYASCLKWNSCLFYLVAGNETKAEMPNLINQFKTWWEAHRTISDLEQYLSFLK